MLLPSGEAPVIPVPRRPAIWCTVQLSRYLRSELPPAISVFIASSTSSFCPASTLCPVATAIVQRLRQLENARLAALWGIQIAGVALNASAAQHTRLDRRHSIARAQPRKLLLARFEFGGILVDRFQERMVVAKAEFRWLDSERILAVGKASRISSSSAALPGKTHLIERASNQGVPGGNSFVD